MYLYRKETNTSVTAINDVSSHFFNIAIPKFPPLLPFTQKYLQGRAIDTFCKCRTKCTTPPTRIIRGYICIGKIILFMNVSL